MAYATSKYLVYCCFETKSSQSNSIIAGSLLLDCAMTEEEAAEKVAMYKERSEDYQTCTTRDSSRYIYIENKAEWWGRR